MSHDLIRSAQRWTNTMVAHSLFSHGASFSARISATGFQWSQAAENIAAGYRTPSGVVRAWMRSPDHCRNILAPVYSRIGIGVNRRAVHGAGRGTWTQDFALPLGASPPSRNWGPAYGCPYG